MSKAMPTTILSFLDSDTDALLACQLRQQHRFDSRWIHALTNQPIIEGFPDALKQSAGTAFDVMLVPIDSDTLAQISGSTYWHSVMPTIREQLPGAIVAVLSDDAGLNDAVLAATVGFDAILAAPFEGQDISQLLHHALHRYRQRCHLSGRNRKLRELCHGLNHKRRQLRQKVDLLCNDLVTHNQTMAHALQRYRNVYEFQNQLVGEYDLNCLLHKALRIICEKVDNSCATLYLNHKENFEAHIVHPRFKWGYLLLEHEALLAETVVSEVLLTRGTVAVADASVWNPVMSVEMDILDQMSIIGAPISLEGHLVAVLIVYRFDQAYTPQEIKTIESYLPTLGHNILAIDKLNHFLAV